MSHNAYTCFNDSAGHLTTDAKDDENYIQVHTRREQYLAYLGVKKAHELYTK